MPEDSASKNPQPRQYFDIARPGAMRAATTSRPIVGRGVIAAADPMLARQERSTTIALDSDHDTSMDVRFTQASKEVTPKPQPTSAPELDEQTIAALLSNDEEENLPKKQENEEQVIEQPLQQDSLPQSTSKAVEKPEKESPKLLADHTPMQPILHEVKPKRSMARKVVIGILVVAIIATLALNVQLGLEYMRLK